MGRVAEAGKTKGHKQDFLQSCSPSSSVSRQDPQEWQGIPAYEPIEATIHADWSQGVSQCQKGSETKGMIGVTVVPPLKGDTDTNPVATEVTCRVEVPSLRNEAVVTCCDLVLL